MLELTLFGPPTLTVDGRTSKLPIRKALGLLAYLALERPCSRAELASLLWTDSNTQSARRSLRQELWRLHTSLGDLLEGESEQIRLKEPFLSDVARFSALLAQGELAAALSLYRAPLLEDFSLRGASAFEEWLEVKRESLASAWRGALVRHAMQLERDGDLRGALKAHQTLLGDDPLQEAHQRGAMRLHALLGETTEALERFEGFKKLLARELHLEPLAETARVAQQIRHAESPNERPSAAGVNPTLTGVPPMVGRDDAWAALQRPLRGLTLVLGLPGIGKTRLLEEFCGPHGLWLRAREVSHQTPLAPVADALRLALPHPEAGVRLSQLAPMWRREAARLVPELESDAPSNREGPPSEGARARFMEGVVQAVWAAAGPGGAILFDDLHWADALSVELLSLLVHRAPSSNSPPRVLATARPFELEQNPAVMPLLRALERSSTLHKIELEHLDGAEVLTLVQRLSGASGGALFAQRLCEATGGNPLFLVQTLRHLFEIAALHRTEHGWATAFDDTTLDYTELSLPAGVGEAILARVNLLGGGARRLLEAASLTDAGFRLDLLSGAVALSEWEAVDAFERLSLARLIKVLEPGGYGFSHDLVRLTLEDGLSLERKALLHRKLAQALEESGGPAASIARHLERGGQPSGAAPWRVRAAQGAELLFAYPEALLEYQAALNDGIEGRAAFEVHLSRLGLYRSLHDTSGELETLKQAATLAQSLEDPHLKARVALQRTQFTHATGRYTECVAAAQSALEFLEHPAPPDLALRTDAHYMMGVALALLGRYAEAEQHCQTARDLSHTAGVSLRPGLQAGICIQLCYLALHRADFEAAHIWSQESFAIAEKTRDLRVRALCFNAAGRLALTTHDRPRAIECLERALQDARAVFDVRLQDAFLFNAIRLYVEGGELDVAQSKLEQGLRLTAEPRDTRSEANLLKRRAEIQVLRHDLTGSLASYQSSIVAAAALGWSVNHTERWLGLAELRSLIGDTVGARATVQAMLTSADFPAGLEDARLEAQLAQCDFDEGQLAYAHTRLLRVLDPDRSPYRENTEPARLILGRTLLARDEPERALGALADLDPRSPSAASALTLRLKALSQLGRDLRSELDAARALLGTLRVSPFMALDLCQTLVGLCDPLEAQRWQNEADLLGHTLLGNLPLELQAGFRARWNLSAAHTSS